MKINIIIASIVLIVLATTTFLLQGDDTVFIEAMTVPTQKTDVTTMITATGTIEPKEELPETQFMRVHRSYIVSLNNIHVIERSQIIINEKRITISDHYKPKFLDFITNNSLNL